MTSPRILLAASNLRPEKKLGQHFLSDNRAAEMIAERSRIMPDDIVLEIGAGLGAITIPTARIAKHVYAVEKDRRLTSLLKVQLIANGISNVTLIENNILSLDLHAIVQEAGSKPVVIGNLPYNISSQILVWLIRSRDSADRAILMFQKELAERLKAHPGCKQYGRLTVMLRYCAGIRSLVEVGASCFFPRPNVDSEVVEIRFYKTPEYPVDDETFFFATIKAAFGQRRKTLKNSLSGSELGIDSDTALKALINAGIDPSRRAETLNISEFVRLSENLKGSVKSGQWVSDQASDQSTDGRGESNERI